MTGNLPNIASLHDLLISNTRSFSSAEAELKISLGRWINVAGSEKLKIALQKYLHIIDQHLAKLETFFQEENIQSVSIHNRVMQAFLQDLDEKLSRCSDAEVRDSCLLAGIQEINHFKISIYGTAAAFAKAACNERQAAIFHESEVNEKQTDDRLSQLAEHEINIKAKGPIILPG